MQDKWSARPLTELAIGEQAEVVVVMATRDSRLTHLSTFGLVPGSRVTLQQRRPAYVIQIGETQVTIDADIAREIMVRV
jgi:DtxR family Mn-dependent transcriptional regulator